MKGMAIKEISNMALDIPAPSFPCIIAGVVTFGTTGLTGARDIAAKVSVRVLLE